MTLPSGASEPIDCDSVDWKYLNSLTYFDAHSNVPHFTPAAVKISSLNCFGVLGTSNFENKNWGSRTANISIFFDFSPVEIFRCPSVFIPSSPPVDCKISPCRLERFSWRYWWIPQKDRDGQEFRRYCSYTTQNCCRIRSLQLRPRLPSKKEANRKLLRST